jgi:hypothetical protein
MDAQGWRGEFYSIGISTPHDAARAFKQHTTYIIGAWNGGKTFAFKKVGAFDREAILKATVAICMEAEAMLYAAENAEGAGI